MEKKLKWYPMDIDLHAFMEFVRRMGAASISEIKTYFHTDSASVRKVAGFLWHHNKIWVLSHGRGIFIAENTGKKGSVSVNALRQAAGVVRKKPGPKGKKADSSLSAQDQLVMRRSLSHRDGTFGDDYEHM